MPWSGRGTAGEPEGGRSSKLDTKGSKVSGGMGSGSGAGGSGTCASPCACAAACLALPRAAAPRLPGLGPLSAPCATGLLPRAAGREAAGGASGPGAARLRPRSHQSAAPAATASAADRATVRCPLPCCGSLVGRRGCGRALLVWPPLPLGAAAATGLARAAPLVVAAAELLGCWLLSTAGLSGCAADDGPGAASSRGGGCSPPGAAAC